MRFLCSNVGKTAYLMHFLNDGCVTKQMLDNKLKRYCEIEELNYEYKQEEIK